MHNSLIPTLDFNDFLSDKIMTRTSFVTGLKEAFEKTGFFFLKNHGISPDNLNDAQKMFISFFDFPEDMRKKYEFIEEKHQRGYTPPNIEKGEFANKEDEKHFFQFGEDRNVEVEEIPHFREISETLFREFQGLSRVLLSAVALSLSRTGSYFDAKEGNSIMRAIDYPPTDTPATDDRVVAHGGNITGMCASMHTDINMITLLHALEPGLQLWHNESWYPVTIEDNETIIVNCGDMLWHMTAGQYLSGLHRVVCQPKTRRFSIPYFCHVKLEASIKPLPEFKGYDEKKFCFNTAGEFLDYRLKQIGL